MIRQKSQIRTIGKLVISPFSDTLEIRTGAFANLPNLTNLSLTRCKLENISVDVFNISTLRYLDLSINPFTDIPKNLFRQLSRLEVLKLTGVGYVGDWKSESYMLPESLTEFHFSPASAKVDSSFADEELFRRCCPDMDTISIRGSRFPNDDLAMFNGLHKLRYV